MLKQMIIRYVHLLHYEHQQPSLLGYLCPINIPIAFKFSEANEFKIINLNKLHEKNTYFNND